MGMTINTNMSALTAYRNLSTTQNEMSKSLEKLSSGLRINRAADDAAGLAISEGLKSQVGGLTVAARNAQDGINVAQTAEGSLGQVQAILQRMRDLAVQAGSDSNNVDSRKAITTEATALTSELGRIASSTNFNGINLLDGTAGSAKDGKLIFQVGANGTSDNQITLDLSGANVKTVVNTLNAVDASGNALTGNTATTGVTFTAATVAGTFTIAQAGTGGKTFDVSFGAASGTRTDAQVLSTLQTAAGSDFVVTADSTAGNYTIATADSTNSGAVTAVVNTAQNTTDSITTGGFTAGTAGTGAAPTALDFSSAAGAQAAITAIDKQITAVSTARAGLGADQNRLEYTITNLNISKENLTASQSQITDTDMASEMVNFTRSSILSQAGTAMLAQANQANSGVLKLLQ